MHAKFIKGSPLPESMGASADLYKEVQELRLAMEAETRDVKARESEIREHIIENLSAEDTGAAGQYYRVQVRTKTKPKVSDWEAVHTYISTHQRFDLLQRRLSDAAAMEMLDGGEGIPGVERMHVKTLSVTKI